MATKKSKKEPNAALTQEELTMLVSLIDVGVKAAGMQIGKDNGFATLQSALDKLQELQVKEE